MTGIIGSGMIVTINVLISLVIGGCLAIKLIEKQNRILEVRIWAVPWRDCLFWWGYLKFSFRTKSHGRSVYVSGGSIVLILRTKSHGRSSCLGGSMLFIFRTKLFGEMSTPRRRILLIFRSQLRVVKPKRYPTRNLLKLSLFYRCQLRVVKRKRYVTSNLLKLSLSYRFQLRVTERKCCVTSNHPQIHYDFVKNYVSAEGNLI